MASALALISALSDAVASAFRWDNVPAVYAFGDSGSFVGGMLSSGHVPILLPGCSWAEVFGVVAGLHTYLDCSITWTPSYAFPFLQSVALMLSHTRRIDSVGLARARTSF
ncbi:hypothetical protein AURDEDRAFT_164502 [Auricularia subglabra TFB-10046 SS5]|nr:hypothetical protein AURDEDRAFT_164502 [Auricularia subglabra TFB-10046 SS5]